MNQRPRNLARLWLVSVCIWLSMPSQLSLSQSAHEDEAARLANAGQQALASDRYSEAKTDFEKLAALEPNVAEVHATLAAIHFKLRDYDAAVQEVRTAQKLKPSLPRLDSLLALSLAELGRFHEALPSLEKSFRQATETETKRLCGLQLLRAYTNLNRDPEAVTTALTLNKLYPDDPEVLYQTGRIFGNYAYQVMEKLHDKAPGSIWMIQAQAEAYESQNDYESAIAAYRRVLTMEPNRPGIHYRMGRTYLRRFQASHQDADRDAAQQEFHAELDINAKNGNAAYELAQIDHDQGKLEQAQAMFEQLLVSRPDFEQAHVGLAGVLLEEHKPELAIPHLKEAIKLDASDEVAWYRLARALRSTGDTAGQSKAMAEFQRLHALESGSPAQTGMRTDQSEVTPQKLEADETPKLDP